jgi:hypothetical protein
LQNPGVDGESPALQRAGNGTQTLKTDKHKGKYQVSLSNDKKEAG